MALGTCGLLWLKFILKELNMENDRPMKQYCHNKAAISIAHNQVQDDRMKHVKLINISLK